MAARNLQPLVRSPMTERWSPWRECISSATCECCWSLYPACTATGTFCSGVLRDALCPCAGRSGVSGCSAQCCWLLCNGFQHGGWPAVNPLTYLLCVPPFLFRHHLFIPARTCFLSRKSQLFPSRSIKHLCFRPSLFSPPSSLSVLLWLHPKILPAPPTSFALSSLSHPPAHVSLSLSGLQLKYYKCYCILAWGQICQVINQYSERIM